MGTCVDCKFFLPTQQVGACSLSQWVTRSTWHCTDYEPGPKPLVDELAEASRSALDWLRRVSDPSNPLWSANIDYAIEDLEIVLARYEKEQADG